jgi:hypothetical protein
MNINTLGYMESQVFEIHYRQREKFLEPFLVRLFKQFYLYTCQKSTSHKSDGMMLMQRVITNKR